MPNPIITSAKSVEWSTPQDFFDRLNQRYHFEIDLCATPENAKCKKFYTREQDALKQDWRGVCWMNPPYGRGLHKWMKKAYTSAKENGATIVCLLPARTSTGWWHDYCEKAEYEFVRGKLHFNNSKDPAPFASVVVVFKAELLKEN